MSRSRVKCCVSVGPPRESCPNWRSESWKPTTPARHFRHPKGRIEVHPTIWGDFEMPDGIGIYGGMAPMRPLPGFQDALGQEPRPGLTRHRRIGGQDIPWQVASQQSLPPLLLEVVLQQIDVSRCKHGTSERCLKKSTPVRGNPQNSRMNPKTSPNRSSRGCSSSWNQRSRATPFSSPYMPRFRSGFSS